MLGPRCLIASSGCSDNCMPGIRREVPMLIKTPGISAWPVTFQKQIRAAYALELKRVLLSQLETSELASLREAAARLRSGNGEAACLLVNSTAKVAGLQLNARAYFGLLLEVARVGLVPVLELRLQIHTFVQEQVRCPHCMCRRAFIPHCTCAVLRCAVLPVSSGCRSSAPES